MENSSHRYDDIIGLPHHVSAARPRMSARARAAQFAPFAALTGYDAAVAETARLTDAKRQLTDEENEILNQRLQKLSEKAHERPIVSITYFLPDERKSGGCYRTKSGAVRWIDEGGMKVVFADGERINLTDICDISGSIFDQPPCFD